VKIEFIVVVSMKAIYDMLKGYIGKATTITSLVS